MVYLIVHSRRALNHSASPCGLNARLSCTLQITTQGYTIYFLITAPKKIIQDSTWRLNWNTKNRFQHQVALKLGWRLVIRMKFWKLNLYAIHLGLIMPGDFEVSFGCSSHYKCTGATCIHSNLSAAFINLVLQLALFLE